MPTGTLMTSNKQLISNIESALNCNLLVLFYNTDDPVFRTQLALDILPHLRKALDFLKLNESDKPFALLLQSSGGILDSSWPIVSAIRAATITKKNDFWVIVNEKAHSAATLITIGADKILMSPYGSLSPIDPQLNLSAGPNIRIGAGIEDIQGYYDLIKRMFDRDDNARAQAFALLANRIPPEILGQVERIHKLIRMLSKKMLNTRKENINEEVLNAITRALTEEFFSHNYQISMSECKELGLPVFDLQEPAKSHVEQLCDLYLNMLENGKDLTIDIPPGENQAKVSKKRAFLETKDYSVAFQSEVTVNRDRTAQVNDLGWR